MCVCVCVCVCVHAEGQEGGRVTYVLNRRKFI